MEQHLGEKPAHTSTCSRKKKFQAICTPFPWSPYIGCTEYSKTGYRIVRYLEPKKKNSFNRQLSLEISWFPSILNQFNCLFLWINVLQTIMDFEIFRSSLFILHVVSAMFAIQVFLSEEFRLYDQEIYSVLKRKPPPLTAPLQKVVSTKEIRKIDTCLVSLSSSQL